MTKLRTILHVLPLVLTTVLAPTAWALKVGDVSHLKGQRTNHLTGLGLVTGLRGTGDGNASAQASRALAAFLEKFGAPVLPSDTLDLKNVAIVHLSVSLPEHGTREGDRVDVDVSAVGGAKSIDGGFLMLTPLLGPPGAAARLYALASGRVVTDEATPNLGRIRGGAVMEQDVIHHYLATGRDVLELYGPNGGGPELTGVARWLRLDQRYITLLVDERHASWAMAETIALEIDREYPSDLEPERRLALARSPSEIIVQVPPEEADRPSRFIRTVQQLELLLPPLEARVVVNRRKGTIVVTGDVEISPVGITVKGLSITAAAPTGPVGPLGAVTGAPTVPTPDPAAATPQTFLALDPENRGGTKLTNLIAALNQLQVDTDRQIDVIEELHRAGQLHAKLIAED